MGCTVLRRFPSAAVWVVLCLLLPSGFVGCSGAEVDMGKNPRITASGNIEFDGQPVLAGTVSFMNIETGYTADCKISGGSYESGSSDGPNPGENLVMVDAREKADGYSMWSTSWTKKVMVDESGFSEDFSITSDEVQPFDPAILEDDD